MFNPAIAGYYIKGLKPRKCYSVLWYTALVKNTHNGKTNFMDASCEVFDLYYGNHATMNAGLSGYWSNGYILKAILMYMMPCLVDMLAPTGDMCQFYKFLYYVPVPLYAESFAQYLVDNQILYYGISEEELVQRLLDAGF